MSFLDEFEGHFEVDHPFGRPGDTWTTKKGERVLLPKMSTAHILNCMRLVGEEDDWYVKFLEELRRRKVACRRSDKKEVNMADTKQDIQRAHAWCFENGVSAEQMQSAWDNAIVKDNPIARNLSQHGFTWRKLAPHLLQQLIERY